MYCPSRIQAKSGSHVKYKAGSLSPIASLGSRIQTFGLRGCVGQVLFVPVPAWLDMVQHALSRQTLFGILHWLRRRN